MPADIKGLAVISIQKWVSATYGAPVWDEALGKCSELARQNLDGTWATSWIPVHYLDELWRNLIAVQGLSGSALEQAFVQQGEFVAEDNLNTILRALLTFFVTPKQLFGQFPRVWGMYFRGLDVRAELGADSRSGIVTVNGVGGVTGLAPVVYGWLFASYRRVGAKEATCVERAWAEGHLRADPLVFDVTWRT